MTLQIGRPQNGADILVQCLLNHGVDVVFAYPGGASMPIHQALTRVSSRLRTILPRHEQGGGFAAEGYARSSGRVGVCVATSGPGATPEPGPAVGPELKMRTMRNTSRDKRSQPRD